MGITVITQPQSQEINYEDSVTLNTVAVTDGKYSLYNWDGSERAFEISEWGAITGTVYDDGAIEYTILYNYYSEEPVTFIYPNGEFTLENNEAVAYCGQELLHQRKKTEGISICISLAYAKPNNPHFALGEYNGLGYKFKSTTEEIEENWL